MFIRSQSERGGQLRDLQQRHRCDRNRMPDVFLRGILQPNG